MAGPSNRIESLEASMERQLLDGQEGTMNKVLSGRRYSGRMTSVWPAEDSDLVVYPKVADADRARFTRGLSSSLAS